MDGVRRPLCRVVWLLVLAATLAAGCGSDDGGRSAAGNPAESSGFPVTIDAANGELTLERRPEAIVSLSPTATEVLFAIGAGDQVTAVDDQSNYPAEAPASELSGFEPNIEAIASYEPDLVVFATETGDLEKSLEKLDIPALQQDAAEDLEGTYAQIEELGLATGHPAEAEGLVASMQKEIAGIVESLPDFQEPPAYYHELDPTYFTATSDSFIGAVYGELGLVNIADGAPKSASGYVQLSPEYIIDADPDLIFLADVKCCDQSIKTLRKRPGWDEITAVQTDSVVEVDDDIASRWGPRVVDFLRIAADQVAALAAGG